MEQLLIKIGELVATEIDAVDDVKYVRESEGSFTITLSGGTKYSLWLERASADKCVSATAN